MGKLEVCFVLDESGSVCTTGSTPQACTGTGTSSTCGYNGLTNKKDPNFCPKFNTDTKGFVKGLMQSLDTSASSYGVTTRYAVSTFSSNADKDQDLKDTAATTVTVTNLEYEGGYTQTAEGMEACQDILLKGYPVADKLIVLVTDGRPRKDSTDPQSYFGTTKSYATNIKAGKKAASGTPAVPMKILAVGVKTVESDLTFVQELASPGLSVTVSSGYEDLSNQISIVASDAVLSSCGGTITRK